MNKEVKLILALMALLEYGSKITETEDKYIVRGDQYLYGTCEEEDMCLSDDEIIEMAEMYCNSNIVVTM